MSTAVARPLLSIKNITHSFGAQPVLDGVSVTVHAGDRIGLIGRNGSGKSTLMKLMAGLMRPESGEVARAQGLKVSMLSQECPLDRDKTVETVLHEAAAEQEALLDAYHVAMEKLAGTHSGADEHDALEHAVQELQHAVEAAGAWDLPERMKRLRTALGLAAGDRKLGTLSGGELRRVDLAYRLLEQPDVLLLDEPTNHIDTQSAEWIENFLVRYSGSCVLVTHDRYFLDRAVNRIIELEHNHIYSFPGNYARFLEYKANVEETRANTESNRLAFLRRELSWYRRGPKARTSKDKHRMEKFEEMRDMDAAVKHREFTFEIPEPERLGKTILEARKITHGFGDSTLIRDFNLTMQAGMRVGIVGPNGSGKTTLLRVLMGNEEARKGKIIIGDNTRFLYVDQAHGDIKPEESVLDFVSDGAKHWEIAKRRIYVPAYLEKFLFDKNVVNEPMGKLSGGERNRLDLARKLLRGGNFLVLDEPTNDLDLYTLRVLEETIASFDGCALIVSHDRWFLNRICTHMLVFEGDGVVTTIVGNYDDYLLYRERREADRKAEAAAAPAPKPERAAPAAGAAKRKLSYKEKQELEGMEESILAAEAAVEELDAAIHAPGFFEQGHTVVQDKLRELEEARVQVKTLYARWEELEAIQAG